MKNSGIERLLGIIAFIATIAAFILGLQKASVDLEPYLIKLINDNETYHKLKDDRYQIINTTDSSINGYIVVSEGKGYGGPLSVATSLDTMGNVIDLVLVNHNETPSYIKKVENQYFYRNLVGKNYKDKFKIYDDIDAITGATYTTEALANAVKEACYLIAKNQLNNNILVNEKQQVKIDIPLISLIILYSISFLCIYYRLKRRKLIRWIVMLSGLLILGFWFTVPLALQRINMFLIGYFPDWHSNLYWYLLIVGGLIVFIFTNKRVYCNWICPFGATQECLNLVGGTKKVIKGKAKLYFDWVQRTAALIAIILALYFRNPVKINYEIFGAFFDLTGSSVLFIVTAVYVVSAIFIKRPYCNTLCPITPVLDYLGMIRKWIMRR